MKCKKLSFNNIDFYTVKSDAYKSCFISVIFYNDVNKVNYTGRALLSRLMVENNKLYPSRKEICIREGELYDPSFNIESLRYGKAYRTELSISFLDPKYVKEKDYLKNIMDLFLTYIFNPNIKDGRWDEVYFKNAYEGLKNDILDIRSNPMLYANIKSLESIFPNTLMSKRFIGNIKDLEKLDSKNICMEHTKLLHSPSCHVLINGDLDIDYIRKRINESFKGYKYKKCKLNYYSKIKAKKKDIVEKSNYNQTILIKYFDFKTITKYEEQYVLPILSKVFGNASLADILNDELRSKNSLCYGVGFAYTYRNYGARIVVRYAKENTIKVKEAIDKCLKILINGDYPDALLKAQKQVAINSTKRSKDNPLYYIDEYYNKDVLKIPTDKEFVKEVSKITKEDISKLAKKFKEVATYILEDSNEEN